MMRCYQRGDAEDPAQLVAAIATVFLRYPESVVLAVADPVDGLPGTLDWLPKIPQVKRACEAEAAKQYRAAQAEAVRNAPRLSAPLPPSDEARARAVAHWLAIRPMFEPEPKRGSAQPSATTEAELRDYHRGQLKRLAAKSGVTLTDADIAAVPDA